MTIQKSFHIYKRMVRISFKGLTQYRADILAGLVGVFLLNAANIGQISILSWKFTSIGDWSIGDLILLYGLFMICHSIFTTFFFPCFTLGTEVLNGTFDKYLIRPVSPFLQFLGGHIRYVGLCDFLLGVILIGTGYHLSHLSWSAGEWLLLLFFMISGSVALICLRLIISCVSFWTVKASALHSIVQQVNLLIQKYPASIFGSAFRWFATVVFPIALMNYYPAVYLLGKTDEPAWLCLITPLISVLFVFLARISWKQGIRRYASAGG